MKVRYTLDFFFYDFYSLGKCEPQFKDVDEELRYKLRKAAEEIVEKMEGVKYIGQPYESGDR